MRPRNENSAPTRRQPLTKAVRYAAGHVWSAGRGHCLAMATAALLAALLAPVSVVVLGMVVREINRAFTSGGPVSSTIGGWIVLGGAAAVAGVAVRAVQRYSQLRLTDALELRMQRAVLDHASRLELARLEETETQNLLERACHHPGQSVLGLLQGVVQAGSGAVQLAALAGVLVWIEPWWSLLLVAASLPFLAARRWLAHLRHLRHCRKTDRRRWSRYYSRLLTQHESATTVKLLGLAPALLERHQATLHDVAADNRTVDRYVALVDVAATTLTVSVIVTAAWFAAGRAAAGDLDVGLFTAFWVAAWQFRGTLADFGRATSDIFESSLATEHLREFLEVPAATTSATTRRIAVRGEIELDHVSFRYGDGPRTALRNVTLSIQPGETVALVGPNGAGKSTLAKLIARIYQPTEGQIQVDGTPLERLDLEHFQRQLSFVLQRPTRFEATAAENIAFGDWDRLRDDPRAVRQIARQAGIDEMLEGLPEGYDTILGRMFGKHDLSGGQWQKVAIARALAGDPRIVILDEPAAGLDVDAQLALHEQLRELLRGRTGILISHSFATVRMADRIFVLVEGELVEQGTHEELCALRGVYAAMCESHEAAVDPRRQPPPSGQRQTASHDTEDVLNGSPA